MKKIFLLIALTFLISCSENNSKKKIPENYKIIEMNVSHPNDKDNKYKIKFDYKANGKLNQILHISKTFSLKENFEYQSEKLTKIAYINSNPSLNVNKIFEYDNKGKLRYVIIERMIESKTDSIKTLTKSALIEFKYAKNEIEILTKSISDNPTLKKELMTLDKVGNFLDIKNEDNSKSDKIYDNKNSINDLIFDKSLVGYKLYGMGNLLTLGDKISNTYEYNDLGFPTEKRTFYSGKLTSITIYIYNE